MRVLIVVASCASSALWAAAPTTPPPPDSNALKLDQTIQGLKDEVLQFNRDATALEQDSLYPPYTRTNVFLGVRFGNLIVKQFSVSFDGGEAQKYDFEDVESLALLQNKNLRRVMSVNLAPGPHKIHASFTAQFADAKADAPPLTGNLDANFDKNYNNTDLQLMLVRTGFLAPPSLALEKTRSAR